MPKHSSSVGTGIMNASGRNFSSKSAQMNSMPEKYDTMSIQFDGKEINTIHDLIANFKLDNYQESKRKRELGSTDPDNPLPGAKDVDTAYWDMIQ